MKKPSSNKDKFKLTGKDLPVIMLDGGIKYTGPVKAGVPHTQEGVTGDMVWPTGDRYIGEFKHGKRKGKGKRVNKDGSAYEGEYSED